MIFRLILASSLFLTLGGCLGRQETPPIEARSEVAEDELRGFYCANTDQFRWTDETWKNGIENDPANTRRAVAINQRRDAWCPGGGGL